MNAEALERLMIDRAAGDVSPDVEELLEAWLTEKPAARADADEIEETIELARRALQEEGRANVVSFPAKQKIGRLWALAACFAGGLVFGTLLHRETNVVPPAIVASTPTVEVHQNARATSSVWSLARMRGVSAPEKRSVVWISPVRKPKIL